MLVHGIVLWMATATTCSPQALKSEMKAEERAAKGTVGVSAAVTDSREFFSFHGGRGFPMQSVYKLPIAIAALHQLENGKLQLDQPVHVDETDLIPPAGHSPLRDKHRHGGDFTIEELLRRAIVDSDGSASDVLLRVMGGTRAVRRYMKEAGLKGIRVQHTEAQLIDDTHAQYEDSAKPDAMVELLRRLQKGELVNPSHTSLLLVWMKEAESGRERIRGKLPSGTAVADKTGSSGTTEGVTAATNDVGLVRLPDGREMAIAIFVRDAKTNAATRNGVISGITKEIWDCWAEQH